jgi:hypothetical protein
MDFLFVCDLVGEIAIPLENNVGDKSTPSFLKLETVLEKNFMDFRSILFQGELLRLFVIIKLDPSTMNSTNDNSSMNMRNFVDNLHIKFEFDTSCDDKEIELLENNTNISIQPNNPNSNLNSKHQFQRSNTNTPMNDTLNNVNLMSTPISIYQNIDQDNDSSTIMAEIDKNVCNDLFSLQRSSLFNHLHVNTGKPQQNTGHYNYKNLNYDIISRRLFLEDKNIAILEVIRHITVPNKFLNKNLILKLNIQKKNPNDYLNKLSMSEIFTSGIYNEVREFTIIKTLFKEVKIIRPLYMSKTKQIDITPDTSFLQIKVENITSSINFIDKSLKLSRFLAKLNSENEEVDVVNYGISLTIKDVQILKEETVVDKKTTINLKSLEQYIKNDTIPLNNIHFTLLNNEFPIEIRPGEEVVLMIKVFKSSFIYERNEKIIDSNNGNMMQSKIRSVSENITTGSNLNTNSNILNKVNSYYKSTTIKDGSNYDTVSTLSKKEQNRRSSGQSMTNTLSGINKAPIFNNMMINSKIIINIRPTEC